MSQAILIQDLQQKSGDRIAKTWREAESAAVALREAKAKELQAAEQIFARQMEDRAQITAGSIIRQAEIAALQIEDDGRRDLADRLYRLALQQLESIRRDDYDNIFKGLVAELPEAPWQEVRVSPMDMDLAQGLFPGAKIISDPGIIGGFEAATDNRSFRVASTLRGRLEKVWPFVLPVLMQELTGTIDAASAD